MTPNQFLALAQLLRLRGGKATDAARMVLVDGASQAAAARATGLTPQAVHNAVKRVQAGRALAFAAAGSISLANSQQSARLACCGDL